MWNTDWAGKEDNHDSCTIFNEIYSLECGGGNLVVGGGGGVFMQLRLATWHLVVSVQTNDTILNNIAWEKSCVSGTES